MEQILLYALPVFIFLIAAEWLYGWKTGRSTYHLNDSLSSLSQGLLSQALAACTTLLQIGLYSRVFSSLALWPKLPFWHTAWGWLTAIVLFDFFDYWLHRAGHEIAVFWAAHVVHHQSESFNFSTALRQESLVPLLGWSFYLPMALLGVPPAQFAVAGLIVLIYQFWIHTEHIGKLGWFDRVFSSPSNHRVHHAVNPEYINKNYGGMLIIWDRLFGTFAEEQATCRYGTQTPLRSWNPLWAVASVYVALGRDALHTRRWRDKLRLWFMPTGWRPADVLTTLPQGIAGGDTSHAVPRYDPPLPRTRAVVALSEFFLMMALSVVLLVQADDLQWGQRALLCVAISGGLLLTGYLMMYQLRLQHAILANLPIAALVWWALA